MLSLYKIWAAEHVQEKWTAELENFIMSRKPQTHEDLEIIIEEFNKKMEIKKSRAQRGLTSK